MEFRTFSLSLFLHIISAFAAFLTYQELYIKISTPITSHKDLTLMVRHNLTPRKRLSVADNLSKVRAQRNIISKKTIQKKQATVQSSMKKKKEVFKTLPQAKEKPKQKKTKDVKKENKKDVPIEQVKQPLDSIADEDPRFFVYINKIQHEFGQVWEPPIGIPEGIKCLVKLVIDKKGEVELFDILEKSKVVIFDLSVVRDAKKLNFAHARYKELWGKTFEFIMMG